MTTERERHYRVVEWSGFTSKGPERRRLTNSYESWESDAVLLDKAKRRAERYGMRGGRFTFTYTTT